MKLKALEKTAATARTHAQELDQQARQAGSNLRTAKEKAREAKTVLKHAKSQAKKSRQTVKEAKTAFTKLALAAEKAMTKAALLEKKLQKWRKRIQKSEAHQTGSASHHAPVHHHAEAPSKSAGKRADGRLGSAGAKAAGEPASKPNRAAVASESIIQVPREL